MKPFSDYMNDKQLQEKISVKIKNRKVQEKKLNDATNKIREEIDDMENGKTLAEHFDAFQEYLGKDKLLARRSMMNGSSGDVWDAAWNKAFDDEYFYMK
jgi:hypothetical protein